MLGLGLSGCSGRIWIETMDFLVDTGSDDSDPFWRKMAGTGLDVIVALTSACYVSTHGSVTRCVHNRGRPD